MDVQPRADRPWLRALEVNSRLSEDEEWHTALNLHARFIPKPGGTLTIIDLGSEFDIEIRHVCIYKVPDVDTNLHVNTEPDDDNSVLESNSNAAGKGSSGPKLLHDDKEQQGEEASKTGKEETPRKLYSQGMGLPQSPTRVRLFPASPSITSGQGASRQLGPGHDYGDDDKENESPDDPGDTGHSYPQHQQSERTDAAAVHSSSSTSVSRGRTMARLVDLEVHQGEEQQKNEQKQEQKDEQKDEQGGEQEGEQEEREGKEKEKEEEGEQEQHQEQYQEQQQQPLTGDDDDIPPFPPSLVLAPSRGERTDATPQIRSRIPVRSQSFINPSEAGQADPPHNVECSPIAKLPEQTIPFPDISPEKSKSPERGQLKSDSEPTSAHGKPDSLGETWDSQSEEEETNREKEGGRVKAALERGMMPEWTESSPIGEWLRREMKAEEFDCQQSESSSEEYYTASTGNGNRDHQDEEVDPGTALSEHQPQADDNNIPLPSPSSASKRSMPWNSAERIALEAKSTPSSEAEEPSSAQKVLDQPELENRQGEIYVRFPENIKEELLICHATVQLRVASLDAAEGRSIAITCSIAQVEKVAYDWGERSEPTLALPAVTTVSLVGPISAENRNKGPKNTEEKEGKEPSDSHEDDNTRAERQAESKVNGDWKQTLRRIAEVLGWFENQFNRLVIFLSWLKQQWQEFADVHERREILPRPEPMILKYALIALVCSIVVSTVDWHCHLNSWEQRYSGSPGYYRQDARSQFSLCSIWIRGGDAIKGTLEGFLSKLEGGAPEHGSEVQTAETRAVQPRQSEQGEPAAEEEEAWITPRMPQRPVSPAEIGEEARDAGTLPDLHDQDPESTEAEQLEENAGHETGEENAAKQSTGDEVPSLRDRIDWFLGWKGPVECPAAGYRCRQAHGDD